MILFSFRFSSLPHFKVQLRDFSNTGPNLGVERWSGRGITSKALARPLVELRQDFIYLGKILTPLNSLFENANKPSGHSIMSPSLSVWVLLCPWVNAEVPEAKVYFRTPRAKVGSTERFWTRIWPLSLSPSLPLSLSLHQSYDRLYSIFRQ